MDKDAVYAELARAVAALADGASDDVSRLANAAAAIHAALPYASWTGFYRVVAPELLRVGPFQGPVACVEIPFARGVCGAAARTRTTQVVPDVHAFPGHLACDPLSRSEIVVPILGAGGELVAVLDLDSRQPAAFDEDDRRGLESVAAVLGHALGR